jgi:hypothetical protein
MVLFAMIFCTPLTTSSATTPSSPFDVADLGPRWLILYQARCSLPQLLLTVRVIVLDDFQNEFLCNL